jgi:hypothetical protein
LLSDWSVSGVSLQDYLVACAGWVYHQMTNSPQAAELAFDQEIGVILLRSTLATAAVISIES